jgi:hypothetical protein
MTRGIVTFAFNNERVDYTQLAVAFAAFARRNMADCNICLITDQQGLDWQSYKGHSHPGRYFTDILTIEEAQRQFRNSRTYRDTRYYDVTDTFRNELRPSALDLSPYDETLLVDSDYLILSDSLSSAWGSSEDVLLSSSAITLQHRRVADTEHRLNPYGVPMYWATVMYFQKSERARRLFSLMQHIKDNWDFYQLTYDFPGNLYRNDYALSVAVHILNGFEEGDEFKSVPDAPLLTSFDYDQFYDIHAPNDVSLFVNDATENWKFFVSRVKGINVHCINKLSLLNNMENIMEVLNA